MEYGSQALTERDQMVRRAGNLVRAAIKKGELPHFSTLKCADCDKPAECYDHRDYTKPLDVDAVCRGCNNRRGPGWPFPAEGDRAEYKHGVEKPGNRWGGLDSGDGYEPLAVHLNGITATDLESVLTSNEADTRLDEGLAQLANFDKRGEGTFHIGGRRGIRRPVGIARAEWFKRRDPWFA